MIRKQLVDSEYVKTWTSIEGNIDDSKINPNIFKAQDMYLQPVLGSTFYNYIQEQYSLGTASMSAVDLELLEGYIQPALVEWVSFVVYPFLKTKPTNKSLSQETSNYSAVADRADVKDILNNLRNSAEFYTQRLLNELRLHPELYPLYINPGVENLPRTRSNYFSGISFGGCDKTNDGDDWHCNC